MKTIYTLLSVFLCLILMAASCKEGKSDKQASEEVMKEFLETYRNGEILECKVDGKTYYKCSRNAYDIGSEIFDASGEKVGGCYARTRQIDPICEKMTDCKDIWRAANNIWGKPGVNNTGMDIVDESIGNDNGSDGGSDGGADDMPEDNAIMALYQMYQTGEIERCKFEGNIVYKCAHNAYDAGNEVYDQFGKKIASCYWNSGNVDEICRQLEDCVAMWRHPDNIWKKPAANEIGVREED